MTIVFKVSDNIKPKIIKYYENLKRDKTPPYAIFQAEEAGTIITFYESGKIMFQGISADIDANIWIEMEKKLNNRDIDIKTGKDKTSKKDELPKKNYNIYNTIGSDEVGTGDYFGPIVVCATYVSKEKQQFLRELNVMDSKKITDEKIKEIAPIIAKEIPYQAYILSNKDYNKINHEEINMNKVKAILHNKVLTSLKEKNYPYDLIVVDQFTTPKSYYNYLVNVPNKVTDITFTPKAEDQCLSVACASIISRYIFLGQMKKMSEELNQEVPKGAGEEVIKFAQELVNTKGKEILTNYAKLNFKTTEKIQ